LQLQKVKCQPQAVLKCSIGKSKTASKIVSDFGTGVTGLIQRNGELSANNVGYCKNVTARIYKNMLETSKGINP